MLNCYTLFLFYLPLLYQLGVIRQPERSQAELTYVTLKRTGCGDWTRVQSNATYSVQCIEWMRYRQVRGPTRGVEGALDLRIEYNNWSETKLESEMFELTNAFKAVVSSNVSPIRVGWYDTIRYCRLTCAQNLTRWHLSLAHDPDTNKNKKKNKINDCRITQKRIFAPGRLSSVTFVQPTQPVTASVAGGGVFKRKSGSQVQRFWSYRRHTTVQDRS